MTAFGFAIQPMDANQSKSIPTTLAQAVLPTGFKQLPFNNAIGGAYSYAYSSTKAFLNTSQHFSRSISNLSLGFFGAKPSRKRARSIDSEAEEAYSSYGSKRCRSSVTDMMDLDMGFVEAPKAQTPEQTRNVQPESVWWTEPYYD